VHSIARSLFYEPLLWFMTIDIIAHHYLWITNISKWRDYISFLTLDDKHTFRYQSITSSSSNWSSKPTSFGIELGACRKLTMTTSYDLLSCKMQKFQWIALIFIPYIIVAQKLNHWLLFVLLFGIFYDCKNRTSTPCQPQGVIKCMGKHADNWIDNGLLLVSLLSGVCITVPLITGMEDL